MSTSLSIKGKTPSNDAITSTINYVNPNATNAQLESLATAMNDLTTNTIADVIKITKESLTEPSSKLSRNMTITPATVSFSSLQSTLPIDDHNDPTATITGNGVTVDKLKVTRPPIEGGAYCLIDWFQGGGDESPIEMYCLKGSDGIYQGQIIFEIPADSVYESGSVTLTIT